MERGSVRVALQSGASALVGLLVASMGIAFLSFGCMIPFAHGHGQWTGALVVGGMGLLVTVLGFKRALARRASDLVVDGSGMRVEGGAHAGNAWPWTSVDRAHIVVDRRESVTTQGTGNKKHTEYVNKLVIVESSGEKREIAASLDIAEHASLAGIAKALSAACASAKGKAAAKEPAADTTILRCPGCGAPVAPTAQSSSPCPSCGQAVRMPPELVQRFAALADDARADALVAQLLDQPAAAKTNHRLAFVTILVVAAPPIIVAVRQGQAIFVALGAILAAWGLVARGIADRLALRSLVLGFSARSPAAAGHPYGCRACGAPLPQAAEDRVIVACVYCRAENVIGVDVLGHDRDRRGDGRDDSLAVALARRASARRSANVKMVAGIAIVVVAGVAWLVAHVG